MASLYRDNHGGETIQIAMRDGTRKTLRLGKVGRKAGEAVRTHVERLLNHAIDRQPIARDTSIWLADIADDLYGKLVKLGIASPRSAATARELGSFLDRYIRSRTDLKPRTLLNLKQVRSGLVSHFGEHCDIATVTRGGIGEWHIGLKGKYAKATLAMHVKKARQMFQNAVDHRLIEVNPVKGLKAGKMTNAERFHYIPPADALRVIDKCPDADWRAVFALARFGGLRVPSETTLLRWSDVDWDRHRMIVRSPKTEHHEGRETREVPLFPDLLVWLLDAYSLAGDGARYVVGRLRTENLRTTASKIVRRAGLEPWPKLFQNLRSSFETDLTARFPLHVACAWAGNTEAVAKGHYLQVTEGHFQSAAQSAAEGPGNHRKESERKSENPRKSEGFAQTEYPQGDANYQLICQRFGPLPRRVVQKALHRLEVSHPDRLNSELDRLRREMARG